MKHLFRLLSALFALALLTAACGNDDTSVGAGDDPDDTDDPSDGLDGRQFLSTAVTVDGEPLTLVDGTQISLRFDGDNVGASAGCNSIGGSYSLDGDTLVVTELGMTEIGCDPERHAQDDLVAGLLSSSPTLTLDGDTLVLANDTTVAEFLDREVADPDRRIVGTEWEATGFIDGESAMSMGIDRPGAIVFADESSVRGFDGCNEFSGSAEVSDGSTGGPVPGDGEILWGDIAFDDASCEDTAEYVAAFSAVFDTGRVTVELEGPTMTLLNDDGRGITFRAAE